MIKLKPPFSISNKMLNQIVEISKVIGNLEFQVERNLKLRKQNRIKAIHSSLAIEKNSLSVDQVTAIINGKRVLGDPKEIKEVKNAFAAYEEIMRMDPYEEADFLAAHKLLTQEIIHIPGQYRHSDVGIFDSSGNLVHMGARPQFIADLMADLFTWGQNDDSPEIIKSCVFHYEIETIHPFEDGNGRMGRLWQTVILSKWNPLFAWIPIETIIHENQEQYYQVLAQADHQNDSSVFIEFMLDIIIKTLNQYQVDGETTKVLAQLSSREQDIFETIQNYLLANEKITTLIASQIINKSAATTRKYLALFTQYELLEVKGANRNREYVLKNASVAE